MLARCGLCARAWLSRAFERRPSPSPAGAGTRRGNARLADGEMVHGPPCTGRDKEDTAGPGRHGWRGTRPRHGPETARPAAERTRGSFKTGAGDTGGRHGPETRAGETGVVGVPWGGERLVNLGRQGGLSHVNLGGAKTDAAQRLGGPPPRASRAAARRLSQITTPRPCINHNPPPRPRLTWVISTKAPARPGSAAAAACRGAGGGEGGGSKREGAMRTREGEWGHRGEARPWIASPRIPGRLRGEEGPLEGRLELDSSSRRP